MISWNLKHSIDLRMLSTICTAEIMVFPALGIFSSNTHIPKGLVLGGDTWRRYVRIWKNKTYKGLSVTHPTLIQWWTSWHPTAPALRLRSVRLSPPWPTGEVSTSREPFIDGIRAPIISNPWGSSEKKFEKKCWLCLYFISVWFLIDTLEARCLFCGMAGISIQYLREVQAKLLSMHSPLGFFLASMTSRTQVPQSWLALQLKTERRSW